MEAGVWELKIAGCITGIEGRDNVGEGILCRPRTEVGDAMGAEWGTVGRFNKAKMAAALLRTEGMEFSSCSIPFEWGMQCGWWATGGEGGMIGSISRLKIADDDECLFVCKLVVTESKHYLGKHTWGRGWWNGIWWTWMEMLRSWSSLDPMSMLSLSGKKMAERVILCLWSGKHVTNGAP